MLSPIKLYRRWRLRRRTPRLPTIRLSLTANHYKPYTAPSPSFAAVIRSAAGEKVGTGGFAVSPLQDRVYLLDIRIASQHQRKGFGLTFLRWIAATYCQPITPVKELYAASRFWEAVRLLQTPAFIVTPALSVGDMNTEAFRWKHLQPQAEQLAAPITPLGRGEPWHEAVGRGLT